MGIVRASVWVLVAGWLAVAAGPAHAGKLLQAAPEAMRAYGEQAGYILSSIVVCGGDAAEQVYFRDLARDNLVQLGADDEDLGFLSFHMEAASEAARPKRKECGDDGAVPVASELFRHRRAIERALDGG